MQMLMDELTNTFRTATPADFGYVRALQKKFTNQIGFIPDAATEWLIDAQLVRLALENGEPAGMMLGRDRLRWNIAIRPITQAAVQFDAQRRHHGLQLVEEITRDARAAGQVAIQCCCREGLDANEFWQAAGFEKVCLMNPGNTRGRLVICWRKFIVPGFRPAWAHIPPPLSGWRKAKTIIVPNEDPSLSRSPRNKPPASRRRPQV